MSNVIAMQKTELSLQEKSEAILASLFPEGEMEEVFRVFLDNKAIKGKIYLSLWQSIAGLVNSPMDFDIKVEVREDKTVIHF
jgi:hypothetical protein